MSHDWRNEPDDVPEIRGTITGRLRREGSADDASPASVLDTQRDYMDRNLDRLDEALEMLQIRLDDVLNKDTVPSDPGMKGENDRAEQAPLTEWFIRRNHRLDEALNRINLMLYRLDL